MFETEKKDFKQTFRKVFELAKILIHKYAKITKKSSR
jgi:hypothetical protein